MGLRKNKLREKTKISRNIRGNFQALFELIFKIFDGFDEKVRRPSNSKKAQIEGILQSFEELSESQKILLKENGEVWDSEAVLYFRNCKFDREIKSHFKSQIDQLGNLEEQITNLKKKVEKMSDLMEEMINHEFYKRKYLESESNLSTK